MHTDYHPRNRIKRFYDQRLIDELEYRPIYKLRDALDAMDNAERPVRPTWPEFVLWCVVTVFCLWMLKR